MQAFSELDSLTLEVAMFNRPSSIFDFASILLWFMAVITVTAGELRQTGEGPGPVTIFVSLCSSCVSQPSQLITGATMAAEEDKLHQQGGEFKAKRGRDDSYLDSTEGSVDPRDRADEEEALLDDRSLSILEKGVERGQGPGKGPLAEPAGGLTSGGQCREDAGLSLGTGVIEDLPSFSPFQSLFSSRSLTYEERSNERPASSTSISMILHQLPSDAMKCSIGDIVYPLRI
jgi:hypothetical protein